MGSRIEVIAIDASGSYRVRKLHTTSAAENRIQVLTPGTPDGYHRTYHPETGFVHDVTTNPSSQTSNGYLPTPTQVAEMLWAREDLLAGQLTRFEGWSGPLPADALVVDLILGPAHQRYETWLVRPELVSSLRSRVVGGAAGAVSFREEQDGELIQLHAVFAPREALA